MDVTLGRIVHYRPHDDDGPYAAIVTYVHPGSGLVDLWVFGHATVAGYAATSASRADSAPHAEPGQWYWPPRV